MNIEKREKNCCFEDVKIGECFTIASGGTFIKANISTEDKHGGVVKKYGGAVDLETGKVEYFGDSYRVVLVSAKIVIEE